MILEPIDEIRAQGVTVYPHVIEDEQGIVVTWDKRNKRYVAHDAHCASIGATRDEAIANLKAYATRQQPWCAQCNLPDDICRGHDEIAKAHQRAGEHIAVDALAWQLSQLSADDLGTLARQLARADAGKANLFAEALWSEAMDAEHARVQADDDDMAQLRVAQ